METKFQTSFIPKKPIVSVGSAGTNFAPQRKTHSNISIFFNIGILLFIVSIGMTIGVFAWKSVTLSSQENLKKQLAQRQSQFQPDLIEELKRTNVKIDIAKKLMSNHLALSNVFAFISHLTAERIRFSSLELSAPGGQSNDIRITMKGVGADLSAVAFQSDVLGQLDKYGLRRIVKNPTLANPALDTTGMVSFDFSAAIDPATVQYANTITGAAANGTGEANQNADAQNP